MGSSVLQVETVLTLSCPDRVGVVHAVTGFLAEHEANILDSQEWGDPDTGRFFMRVHVTGAPTGFEAVAERFAMTWGMHGTGERQQVLVLVSKQGHCLHDLLYRHRTGALPAEIVAVGSNHDDFRDLVEGYGIPFHHVDEDRIAELAEGVDLVVLARYMQILSDDLVQRLPDTINIHHSFLPSFKGARPYHQAHERGVKLIGATAHYVTAELDEGPIIEQEVARVTHAHTPEQLAAIGADLETVCLARAVRWHLEHRVLRNGTRTVVL
ncbi:MAG: formyltetrahydrofolate deformylase [Frankiales bacterium]|nr:formyltetrahydrofolate deformylase [Frankiales bacterium]